MEPAGRKKYCCKYPGCNNWYYSNISGSFVNKHFFTLPKDPTLHQVWKNICKMDLSKNSTHWRICEDHFAASDFVNERKENLNFNALPIPAEIEEFSLAEDLPFENELNVQIEGAICTCNLPSTSTSFCEQHFSQLQNQDVCLELANCDSDNASQNRIDSFHVSSTSHFHDHNYATSSNEEILPNHSKFAFLDSDEPKTKSGILSKIGISEKELTPTKRKMYRIHRNISSKLSKLTNLLEKERNRVKILENLYTSGKFQFINDNLNYVTKEFINSQLRNVEKKPSARRWTDQDKAFALSIYKRSPRLYKYLQVYFQLPSSRTLKALLANFQFEAGVNSDVLEHLESQVAKMKPADRYCSVIFDEMSISEGFHYEKVKQYISGYQDLGSLGRSNEPANHALVFMVRGVRLQWKQVLAYYFTAKTISAKNLKSLIQEIISQLQDVGLNVVATVCDQGPTNVAALNQLCAERLYYFSVRGHQIVTIYDVPHLLKNTRNALLRCKIQFGPNKCAKFEYIERSFNFDQKKMFKALPKLKPKYFNLNNDSYMKMKVKVAAAQLSSSVASAIETFVTFANILPSEAIYTAEFVHKIDNLFDSLNSSTSQVLDHKPFRCALSEKSPHLSFWSELLDELQQWKLIHLTKGTDVTNQYKFVAGWRTTIQSIIFLWNSLKNVDGFNHLNLRAFNQDPLENLFSSIRQHGAANTNPTCHQFTAALKTVVVNKLVTPSNVGGNCELDACAPLDNLLGLVKRNREEPLQLTDEDDEENPSGALQDFSVSDLDDLPAEDTQGLAYVAGWALKKLNVPECDSCHKDLFSDQVSSRHLLVSFREVDDIQRLIYASDNVMSLVNNLHESLYKFLESSGFKKKLEDTFKDLFKQNVNLADSFCRDHDCYDLILNKCIPFLIYKFCRDKPNHKRVSDGHTRKMKRFKPN